MAKPELQNEDVAETENFSVWKSKDEEGVLYHLELGGITLHLDADDWHELVTLIKAADKGM